MNTKSKPTIIIAGGGYKVRYLIGFIKDSFDVFVIDLNKDMLKKLPDHPNIHKTAGDATSDYLLRKIDIDNAAYLVAFTNNEDVNYEISSIGKRHNVARIIAYIPTYKNLERFYELGVTVVGGPKDIASLVYNKITHAKKAIGIGLGIGEIVEVFIDEYSPFANKEISQLSLHGIKIGAVYRDNKLIIPQKDTTIKSNDKILLIGYPEKLEYAVNIITSPNMKFPMQYGNTLLAVVTKNDSIINEIDYLRRNTAIQHLKLMTTINNPKNKNLADDVDYTNKKELFKKLSLESFGIVALEKQNLTLLNKIGLQKCCIHKISESLSEYTPILVLSNKQKYKKILVYIFEEDEELIRKSLHTAISVHNTVDVDLDLFVCENENTEIIKKVEHAARRIFSIHKKQFNINKVSGNPIKEFNKIKTNYDFAITSGFVRKNSMFKPNPAYLIANEKDISVFVLLK